MSKKQATPKGWSAFSSFLNQPVHGSSLAFFRLSFGLVMVWHAFRCLRPKNGLSMVEVMYERPAWNFPYPGFEWVVVPEQPWLNLLFLTVAISGLLVASGLLYRFSAVVLFLSFTWTFLLDATRYNNHYYLMCLLAFLLIWLPANRCWSLDRLTSKLLHRKRKSVDSKSVDSKSRDSGSAAETVGLVPFWSIGILRFQLFIVYFFGGIAKFNADWLTGEPLYAPVSKLHGNLPGLFAETFSIPQLCLMFAWGGLIFDLSIGFLLLARRTRIFALALVFLFHLNNHFMFPIGVFPLMAFTGTLIFFDPDWPVRLSRWIRKPELKRPDWKWCLSGLLLAPGVGALAGWSLQPSRSLRANAGRLSRPALALLVSWVLFQSLFPLRHFTIQGDPNWTEEGQNFSWRMMLRAKAGGNLTYHVFDEELQVRDANGVARLNWENWPQDQAKAIHVPIDCRQFQWSHHPGMTVTYEPAVGNRIIFRPDSATDDSMQAARQKIETIWKQRFGRLPVVDETCSLVETLERIQLQLRRDMEASRRGSDSQRLKPLYDAVTIAIESHLQFATARQSTEEWHIQATDLINRLLRTRNPTIAQMIHQMHPFALQGARFPDERFLVVSDSERETAMSEAELMDSLAEGQPHLVWVDLSRMRPSAWQALPLYFVCFENRNLTIIWNHFHELNHIQRERFAARPLMIYQYANRIADVWEKEMGRRPAVHADSYVMINYRYPQPLVDPNVDLASARYTLLGHNSWIMPMVGKRMFGPQGTPPLASEANPVNNSSSPVRTATTKSDSLR